MPMSKKEKDLLNNYRKADDSNKKAICWFAAIAAKTKNQKNGGESWKYLDFSAN